MSEERFAQIGPYALFGGSPPPLGAGVRVDDFYPAERSGGGGFLGQGGTLFLHSTQQLSAWAHARTVIGFGKGPVTFRVHWWWLRTGLFTADLRGWVQEDTEVRV